MLSSLDKFQEKKRDGGSDSRWGQYLFSLKKRFLSFESATWARDKSHYKQYNIYLKIQVLLQTPTMFFFFKNNVTH